MLAAFLHKLRLHRGTNRWFRRRSRPAEARSGQPAWRAPNRVGSSLNQGTGANTLPNQNDWMPETRQGSLSRSLPACSLFDHPARIAVTAGMEANLQAGIVNAVVQLQLFDSPRKGDGNTIHLPYCEFRRLSFLFLVLPVYLPARENII